MEEFIQLKEDNVLKVKIKDRDGNIGCELRFDLEDIEMPLKLSKMEYEHNKNQEWLKNQFIIIDKKENPKKDGLITYKERLKIEAFKEFYKKEIDNLDLLLGEGKTMEILNTMKRKPYYSMFDNINELLEPILPKLQITADQVIDKVKKKYANKEEDNTLE